MQVDDVWQNMPSGYPKFELVGNKKSFTFRFPKFDTKAFYDPTVSLADDLASLIDSTGGAATLTLSLALLIPLLAMFM